MALTSRTKLGPYEIQAPLGAGGMGEVYRARDTTLKRDVAIKVLPASWSGDPERLHRFELEAQAAAALNHPNIVSIFHVGLHDGSPYIVTELLHGENLRDRLRRGPLRMREVLDIGVEIAQGLRAAHDTGIVHRDLKPENLFITKDGRLKILDFGLAKFDPAKAPAEDANGATLDQATGVGQVLGTIGYMSPEQVRAQVTDARSDIFVVGVILYEMLTGKRAFQKPTSAETMSAVLNEDPPAVSQIAPGLPPGLQRVVNRCLAKSPDQRFQHASDLAFALVALTDSTGEVIPHVKHVDASKMWIWIAAAGIIIALVVAVVFWSSRPPANPVVEGVTQLTDDGEPKPTWTYLATDGSRVYFNEGTTGNLKIAQVAAVGGPSGVVSNGMANQRILGLSPDGSTLLARSGRFDQILFLSGRYPLWEVPLPAGVSRRLASLEAQDASFAPDGRVLFALGGDLLLAGKDGSKPQKLVGGLNGLVGEPTISPDGKRIVFTLYTQSGLPLSIYESNANGSGPHPIVNGEVCCARWAPDGSYIVFTKRHEGRQDLWTLWMARSFLQRTQSPVQLTNGPLSYTGPVVSRDGKQIFAIGTKQRGEVVRYDINSKQFVPFLSGNSAFSPTFSSDGEWVAYASYPDHTLWRSRSDGTERLQLTYPPMQVGYPFISPDGKRVAYGNSDWETYVISMDGGQPQKLMERNSAAANWSPDENLLVFTDTHDAARPQLQIFDLRTGTHSVVPESQGMVGGQWLGEGILVASQLVSSKPLVFDLKTQKWSDLVPGTVPLTFVNWNHSPDYKYLYYTTGGADPEVLRIRIAGRKVEAIAGLKDLRQAAGPDGNTQVSVAPDGSPVFTRDIGTQEIYALTVKWP